MRGVMRVGDPAADLAAFVLAERGRAADPVLEGAYPLVLYLHTEAQRDELVAAFNAAHPNALTRSVS